MYVRKVSYRHACRDDVEMHIAIYRKYKRYKHYDYQRHLYDRITFVLRP
jgi:hypothetical protein